MRNLDKKTIKKWVDVWKKASSSLQEIKFNELRFHNYYPKFDSQRGKIGLGFVL